MSFTAFYCQATHKLASSMVMRVKLSTKVKYLEQEKSAWNAENPLHAAVMKKTTKKLIVKRMTEAEKAADTVGVEHFTKPF